MIWNLLHITLLVISLGLYSAYLLWDDKVTEEAPENMRLELIWHALGAVTFGLIAYTFSRFIGWRYAAFTIANFWILFAGMIHMVALKKHFFYVGTTAITDRMQQWTARKLGMTASNLSSIVKLLAYAGSIALLWLT